MPTIDFKAKLYKIGAWTIIRLPKRASEKLPTRGMTMVEGIINGFRFQSALEPDGYGSHWFKVEKTMQQAAGADAGDTAELTIEPIKEWPEPNVPVDLMEALAATRQAHSLWRDITTMARWEWIRWLRATNKLETRKRRIETALSKLKAGERRPCCWNRNLCTEPSVSKNGMLLKPVQKP